MDETFPCEEVDLLSPSKGPPIRNNFNLGRTPTLLASSISAFSVSASFSVFYASNQNGWLLRAFFKNIFVFGQRNGV